MQTLSGALINLTSLNHFNPFKNCAARFIVSDYCYRTSVNELKSLADLPSLESRRKVGRLCLFHKFYFTFVDNFVIMPTYRVRDRISHEKAVYPPCARTPAHLWLFSVQTARNWNYLPADAVQHSNPIYFKIGIEYVIH